MSQKDLLLVPIEVEATVVLNNVFFDFDRATLKPDSYPELNRVAELMEERSGLRIEVAGHTDNIGPDAYNVGLSERRARSVVNYLIGKGIDTSRFEIKYFGNTQPVADNSSREGRRKNRRVEFKILED